VVTFRLYCRAWLKNTKMPDGKLLLCGHFGLAGEQRVSAQRGRINAESPIP
jgi:hypothetical protein